MFLDYLCQGSKLSNAGVGEKNIDSPLCLDLLVETIKVRHFGDVSLNASDIATYCFDGIVEFFLTTKT
jgi:hypothetical protein